MKRLYILILLLTVTVISASAQISRLFDRYSDTKGVTSVYISKAMLRMMGDFKTNGMDLNGMTEKLDAIRVLNTENSSVADKLSSEIKAEVKKDGYEILLSANDDGTKATIYQHRDTSGLNHYLIVAREKGELSLILISGTLTPADVSKMNRK